MSNNKRHSEHPGDCKGLRSSVPGPRAETHTDVFCDLSSTHPAPGQWGQVGHGLASGDSEGRAGSGSLAPTPLSLS